LSRRDVWRVTWIVRWITEVVEEVVVLFFLLFPLIELVVTKERHLHLFTDEVPVLFGDRHPKRKELLERRDERIGLPLPHTTVPKLRQASEVLKVVEGEETCHHVAVDSLLNAVQPALDS